MKIGIPTNGREGLEDSVSEVFGKAKTFTIIDVENDRIRKVKVIENPASSYEYGSGPVVAKTLADLKVHLVISAELGPGAAGLLEHHGIKRILVTPKMKVADAIKDASTRLKGKHI
ncbi:MAG: NifB/NifX family molybdenum-iron cluster-binding protein [Candidatus Bathyarchaeota archaeon]|nr:NifB/NifX family molybdenum-iron cluster-binding protein [Candidatus Bathyarchaeota archaeon]MDH5788248.1 NifB/NifX family molybdenum-iron cluster-binding protein [Candidatus Bathyarchaeota archaeon]